MIKTDYHIRYTGIIGVKKRDWNNNFLKPALYEAGKFWHEWILPKHFTPQGAREYNYKNRTQKYIKRKIVFKGHNNPLMWDGPDSPDSLYNQCQKVRIEATSTGVKCYLPNARKANWRSSPRSPNMADELRRLSSDDHRALVAVVNNHLDNFINGAGLRTSAVRRFAHSSTKYGPVQRKIKRRSRRPARGRTRTRPAA